MLEALRKLLANQLQKSAYQRARISLGGVVLRELLVSGRQFWSWRYPLLGLIRLISIWCSSIFRLILGRSSKYSFAHYGEDLIIEGILKPIVYKSGTYVDVGCNHPKFLSNTYGLYRRGWRGVCIDANKRLIKKYRYLRPKDQAICAVISDQEALCTFYLAENDVLSTITPENMDHPDAHGIAFDQVEVVTRTLNSVLEEAQVESDFDLLNVDVEEHDLQVLKSIDFSCYRPRLVVVEESQFDISRPQDNAIYQLMTSRGYELHGFVLKNLYFVKCSLRD